MIQLPIKKKGEYEGEGLISPEYSKDKDGNEIVSPIDYKWVWQGNIWIKSEICITIPQLQRIFNNAKIDHLKNIEYEININHSFYGLTNYNIICHLLGQMGHETGGFKNDATIEHGVYKKLERIGEVFGLGKTIYKNVEANPSYYLNNEEHFLNMAYANKGGNGDEKSGDGYKFRGRGYIQLTLKGNYIEFNSNYNKKFGDGVNFEKNPELVGTNIKYAIISALFYFKNHTISAISKVKTEGVSINDIDFENITKTINIKKVGIIERKKNYMKAYEVLVKK